MVPDYEEQRRISGLLKSLDDKIAANTEVNKNLQEQAQLIYQSWFMNYDPFGGKLPDSWLQGTLGEIATIKTESWSPAKHPDTIVEHYSIPSFDEKSYPVFESSSGIKSNKYILTPESVMISKLNPDTKRIWRPLCISETPVCSTEFIVYEAKKEGQRDFIFSIIDSVPFYNHLCTHVTGSTNSRQRAMPKTTLDFPVIIPPDELIADFCSIVTPMYDLIASNTVENQSLAATRDSLLPKLMSGNLDVSMFEL
jgi:type I restriction enzyme S subunit